MLSPCAAWQQLLYIVFVLVSIKNHLDKFRNICVLKTDFVCDALIWVIVSGLGSGWC